MSVETMILRFRDLGRNAGETINLHQAKIRPHTYTWWGWWHKAGETIPSETFRALSNIIDKAGSLNVLLFDTGTSTLYPATITEMRWDPRFEEIDSPEGDATPDYYRGRKFKAWYRMTNIGDPTKDAAQLREWSYVDIHEFFETKKTIFKDFDGKQVSSFEELRHQDRTIWFVRRFRAGDKVHEILLYDTSRTHPTNFPEQIIESHSARLLWLSDIHFSKNHHAFPIQDDMQKGNRLAEAIRKDLEALGFKEVGGIIITGDLTWQGSEDEFNLVRSFLRDIMSWSTLTQEQVIICPGNHDIRFSTKPWETGKLVPKASEDSTKNFEKFYTDFFSVQPNEYLACGRRFLLARSFVMELVSLNSSRLRQTEDVFQGQGFVGDDQRTFVASEMKWRDFDENAPRPLRIALLHHHVVPVVPDDVATYGQQLSLVYDAGALCNWIVKHRINLVLHGHMHHTKVVKETRSLGLLEHNAQWHQFTIASMGSTGVELNHNLLDRKNVYGLIEFSKTGIRLRVREITPKDTDRSGEATIVDVEIPDENAAPTV
jgi:DNA repair exonuclease SbcCD nuclease subunit